MNKINTRVTKTIMVSCTALSLLFMPIAPFAQAASLEAPQLNYGQIMGTIEEIIPFFNSDGDINEDTPRVMLKDSSGQLTAFIVTEYTYIPENTRLEIGAAMVGIYDLNAPMSMIYPPQYSALVLAPAEGIQGVKVERFDENLLSADGELQLLPGDYPIYYYNGIAFEGNLTGRLVAVFSSVMMPSFPAQTTPDRIVVLRERNWNAGEAINELNIIWQENNLIVNGKPVSAPSPYVNAMGVIMVPLKEAAEALDFSLLLDENTFTVTLGRSISLTVDVDSYTVGRMAPIHLGTAPEYRNGAIFVPLSFFTQVLGMNNAYMFEGQVVIDDGEKME